MTPTAQKASCCAPATNDTVTTKGAVVSSATNKTRDPVCGMVVDPANAKDRAEHDGQTLYFCCVGCKAKFLADPARFLKAAEQSVTAAPDAPTASPTADTIYTCPMHPQIRRNAPGSCPICGMALEPAGIPRSRRHES